MRTFLLIAAALLAAQTASMPARKVDVSPFRWMRSIRIVPSSGAVPCAPLDGSLFHLAEPALRDLRLTQAGHALPYVIEESYDEHSLDTGITVAADRSFYSTVATVPLSGNDAMLQANLILPARIPVERIRLLQAHPKSSASILVDAKLPEATESVQGTLHPGIAVFPITLGANLQKDATVTITLQHSGIPSGTNIALEMRRRWICFSPAGEADIMLYFGAEGMHGQSSDFATHFTMPLHPALAELGPLQSNPAFHMHTMQRPPWLLRAIVIMALLLMANLAVAIYLLAKPKRPMPTRQK